MAEIRRRAGLTQEALAQTMGVATTTVSNWEQGVTTPYARHRRPLAEALRIGSSELERVLLGHAGDIPRWLSVHTHMEQTAQSTLVLAISAIPALLQTEGYATVVERGYFGVENEGQVSARVELRLRRQDVLSRSPDPLHLTAFIAAHLLHPPMGGTKAMMADQLARLADPRPNVEVRIVDSSTLASTAPSTIALLHSGIGHTGVGPGIVVEEGFEADHYHESPAALTKAQNLFAHLDRTAMPAEDSRRLLKQLGEENGK